jgi:hypothetical protein
MKKIVALIIITLCIFSCKDEVSNDTLSLMSRDYDYSGKLIAANDISESEVTESLVEKTKGAIIERKLIKNGRITFETPDLKRTKGQILSAVKKYKGYISSDSQNEQYDRINNHLTVRVPFQKFDSLLIGISKEIEKFDTKEIKISDVTEQFLDIQTRLKNKKKLEKRYLEILKKAKTVKEIIEVEREIGKLREDIESAEGKLKYLSDQVSFSTLQISFYKKISSESSFSKKLKNALKDGYDSIKSFFIFLVGIWPLVIILLVAFLWYRRRRKKRTT